MKIRPLGGRVLVKRLEQGSKLGSFYIPETAKETLHRGRVVAIARDVSEVETGEIVTFSEFAGTKIELEDGEHLFLLEEDCQGVVDGPRETHQDEPPSSGS